MAKSKQDRLSRSRIHRVERSQRQSRYLTIGAFAILISVVFLVIYGYIFDKFIMPDQPVAIVNGEEISTRDFQARVRFERLPWVNYWNQTAQNMIMFQDNPEFLAQIQTELQNISVQLDPPSFGLNVLEQMIFEVLIRQEAQQRGITVTEEEIDAAIMETRQYFPSGTPTPTISATPIPISTLSSAQITLVSPTPTLTDTPTATVTTEVVETATATLELSPIPESIEGLTPPVDEQPTSETNATPTTVIPSPSPTMYSTEAYAENLHQYYSNLELEFEFTEAGFRKTIESQLYYEKLLSDITKDLPVEEAQIWVRHIQMEDEDSALEILEKLDNGEDWTALASEFSTDPSTNTIGGDLGWLGESINKTDQTEFIGILYEAALAGDGEIGDLIDPIESEAGWHIIQILGSETRIFSEDELSQIRSAIFSEWLAQIQLEYEIVRMDYVSTRIPDEPSPDLELLNPLSNINVP
ncbi:MAG: hypothetical protein FVQ83_02230 [Chloroflexi bacterium]|nr:hypothetical protein [Chloroflexota bacterium]